MQENRKHAHTKNYTLHFLQAECHAIYMLNAVYIAFILPKSYKFNKLVLLLHCNNSHIFLN